MQTFFRLVINPLFLILVSSFLIFYGILGTGTALAESLLQPSFRAFDALCYIPFDIFLILVGILSLNFIVSGEFAKECQCDKCHTSVS